MEVRQSVFGEIVTRVDNHISGVDIDALVRRLLLFDRVIIKSVGLQELPFLVRAFGKQGLLDLQKSGLLQISCESVMTILDVARNGVRELPLCQFSFGMAEIAEREKKLRRDLTPLQGVPGLKNPDRIELEDYVISQLVRPPDNYKSELQLQIEADLRNNTPALKTGLEMQITSQLGRPVPIFDVAVEEIRPRIFRIDTDLQLMLHITEEQVHKLLHESVAAVAKLNGRIADMSAYSAITDFAEHEAPLLFGKLAGIIAPQNPRPVEVQFARVVTLADFPTVAATRRVNVDELLKARESKEWLEFRTWLPKISQASDDEIKDIISSARSSMGSALSSTPGKWVRFAVTTALGLIPGAGLVAGPAAGALDSFLVDRLFPTSGVFAFLDKTYPSLFESSQL
jgi:hypothetical protein